MIDDYGPAARALRQKRMADNAATLTQLSERMWRRGVALDDRDMCYLAQRWMHLYYGETEGQQRLDALPPMSEHEALADERGTPLAC